MTSSNNSNHAIDMKKLSEPQKTERKALPVIDLKCFGCGSENEHGLKMRFETDGSRLYSSLIIADHLRGWSNLAHGGVIASILDEMMSWTAICLSERLILTKKMEVEFLRPVLINEKIFVEGWSDEIIKDRTAIVSAKIMDAKGNELARSKGHFALLKKSSLERLGITIEHLPNSLETLLEIVSNLKNVGENK